MFPLRNKKIESYNNRKFCLISKKKFHDVDDSGDCSDDEFDVRRFNGDAVILTVLHDVNDNDS